MLISRECYFAAVNSESWNMHACRTVCGIQHRLPSKHAGNSLSPSHFLRICIDGIVFFFVYHFCGNMLWILGIGEISNITWQLMSGVHRNIVRGRFIYTDVWWLFTTCLSSVQSKHLTVQLSLISPFTQYILINLLCSHLQMLTACSWLVMKMNNSQVLRLKIWNIWIHMCLRQTVVWKIYVNKILNWKTQNKYWMCICSYDWFNNNYIYYIHCAYAN